MNKPKGSRAIVVDGCRNVTIVDNTIQGFDVGIEATNTSHLTASRNQIVSADAVIAFRDLNLAIRQLDIDAQQREMYLSALARLEQSAGSPSARNKYFEFVGVIANHMSILGPLVGGLAQAL